MGDIGKLAKAYSVTDSRKRK